MERAFEPVSPEAVRLQAAKILASPRFAGAPSLGRFLRFVVEAAISGRGAELKEYLIGVDVFERGEAFDPRIDPIVRVQAGKLRKRLQEYYEGEGSRDSIVIDLRKGSYVPVIRERGSAGDVPVLSMPTEQRLRPWVSRDRALWYRLAAILGLFAAAAAAWRLLPRQDSTQFVLSRLTSDSGQSTHPAVSPGGKLLAFSSDSGPAGDSNIWVQPLSGGEAHQLTRNPAADTSPDFAPDGSQIAFRSWRDGGGIYVVSVLGGQERRIAAGGYSPRFSPDGKWIAFAQDGIHVVPAAGGDPVLLSGNVHGSGCPLWTPDGKHMLFVGAAGDGYDWWAAPLARDRPPFSTGLGARLRGDGQKGLDETTCPSDWMGNSVVFTLKTDGMGNLWKIPVSPGSWRIAGPAAQLVPGPGVDNTRVIRAAGQDDRLLFATDTNISHLWSLNADTKQGVARGAIAQLTRDASLVGGLEGTRPVLSADGGRLIFASARLGNLDIWLKDLRTGKEESLTRDPRPEDQPVADATGTTIAYRVSGGSRPSIYLIEGDHRLPRKLCDDCDHPMDMSADGTVLLYRGGEPWGLNLLDVRTSRSTPLLQDTGDVPLEASFAPGARRIAITVRSRHQERLQAYVVAFDGARIGPKDTWIPIADELYHLYPRWSPDGGTLYFFATRDDHRCLWAVRLDRDTARPVGAPFAVRHFHTVQHYPLSGSWIAVARDRLAFNLTDVVSNIWLAVPAGRLP